MRTSSHKGKRAVVFGGVILAACGSEPSESSQSASVTRGALVQCITVQRPDGVTPGSVEDTELQTPSNGQPRGGMQNLNINTPNGQQPEMQVLLKFALPVLPVNATLVSASLAVTLRSNDSDFAEAHVVNAAWSEATATWTNFYANMTPVNPSILFTFNAETGEQGNGFHRKVIVDSATLPAFLTTVQGWYAAPASNNGLLFNFPGTDTTPIIIRSSEDNTTTDRPGLTLCYDIPDSGMPDEDAGTDSGTPDSGTPDGSTPDASTPDAGPGEPDSGTQPDGGSDGGVDAECEQTPW